MKFNSFKLLSSITETKGIKEINLQRLSNVVAFVGKNGSGKSRILDLIEEYLFKSIDVINILDNSINSLPKSIENFRNEMLPFKAYFVLQKNIQDISEQSKLNPNDQNLKNQFRTLQRQLPAMAQQMGSQNQNQVNNYTQQFSKDILSLKQNYLRRINNNEIQKLQQAINAGKDAILTFENLIENVASKGNYDELKSINQSALGFLAKLPHQLAFDKYDCIANSMTFEERISYKRYLSLKKFIKDFLGKDLSWEQKTANSSLTESGNNVTFTGLWKINDRLFNYLEFSDGEKTLFAYALLFFLLDQNPNLNIKESIIIIDEPELHLHPDSEIDLIEGIRNVIGDKGQLIIATHSINILSTLNYEEIFRVKDGIIKSPSQTTPSESLIELLSIEQRVNKLTDFLSSISIWTYVNFMAQCFSNPEAIESSKENDPQIEAFKKAIIANITKKTNILLDFGAGKGRLYEQIKSDFEFLDKINYCALEPDSTFHGKLTELGVNKIYKSYTELQPNTFDFILLCNVLHEIPLAEWEQSLNSIIRSLKINGYLIIIEAKILKKGEKIGKIGYLLLDNEEIQTLLNMNVLPSTINVSNKIESITCSVVAKSNLKEINQSNIINALDLLEANSLKKIEEMREMEYEEKDLYKVGRLSAFLSQQHINAKIAKKYIEGMKK